MKRLLALLSILACTVALAEPVELTDTEGRTITARLLDLEKEKLTFIRSDGIEFDISLDRLSEESRMTVRQKLGTTVWTQMFPNGLIDAAGQEVSPWVLDGKMVALYFGASWCGPCKPVGERLKALRDEVGDRLELVFISQDRSEADQLRYMRTSGMVWPAVKWADPRRDDQNEVRRLIEEHQAWGIPTVVVLSQKGVVIDPDARAKVEFLPEENIARLQAYDYDRALAAHRKHQADQGKQLTPDQEEAFVKRTRSSVERRIAEFAKLEREIDQQSATVDDPASWVQLLATYYASRRADGG